MCEYNTWIQVTENNPKTRLGITFPYNKKTVKYTSSTKSYVISLV